MNIFLLDQSPVLAAQMQCDRHCVKMILETAQMLCSAFHLQHPELDIPYKLTHPNHPCSVWMRQSSENFDWLVEHGFALSNEYSKRYHKIHKTRDVLVWVNRHKHLLKFPKTGLTDFPIAIKETNRCWQVPGFGKMDRVSQYRLYYIHDKPFAKWDHGPTPDWFKKDLTDPKLVLQ